MYELYFDGGAVPNPGVGGGGAVLYKDKIETHAISVFVGENETNNTCEYTALIKGLELAIENNITDLKIKGDSQLVIKQMKGEYQVKAENLKTLHQKAKILLNKVQPYELIHVKREFNKRADELATKGINSKKETVELIPEIEDIEKAPNDDTIFIVPTIDSINSKQHLEPPTHPRIAKYSGMTFKYIRMNDPELLLILHSYVIDQRLYRSYPTVHEQAKEFVSYCMNFLKLDIEDT